MRALLGIVLLVGCAPVSPTTPSAEEPLTRICVVRPSPLEARMTMQVKDNGRLVSATRGQTYSCWAAMPGRHQITSIDDDTGPLLVQVQTGRSYWLHQDVTRLESIHAHLDWITEAAAQDMIESAGCERVKLAIAGQDDVFAVSQSAKAQPRKRASSSAE